MLLKIRVQPRASRDEIVGPHGEESLRVRITAPPVDGQANSHLLRFIAKAFGVAKGQVELLSGESSREKRLAITAPAKLPLEADICREDGANGK